MEPVYLRALEVGDLDRIQGWRQDHKAHRTLAGAFRYESRAAGEAWLLEKQRTSPMEINLVICRADRPDPIGTIHLTTMDWVARNAKLHLVSGEPTDSSGEVEREAVRLLTQYAMQDLGLVRLYTFVIQDNIHSRRLFEECGWNVEVTMRQHAFQHGQFKDVVIMGQCAGHLAPPAN